MFTRIILAFFLFAGCATQKQATTDSEPAAANLRTHIEYLASDNLEGRRAGTAGEALAAAYIATQFEKVGLLPKGREGFYQRFTVAEGKEIVSSSALSINDKVLTLNSEFFPLVYSGNGSINARPSISLMERGEPWFFNLAETLNENKANPHFNMHESIISKAKDAAKKGATALLIYNTSKLEDAVRFEAKDKSETLSIPVIYISKEAAKKSFNDASASLKIAATVGIKEASRTGTNVVGYINNSAANTVVIGAHFDHLGYGEDNNSRFTGSDKQIHNGADDNASGTAALIELGRLLKVSGLKKSNYLLIAFSGEELGLYGSKYFTQNPTVDLGSINFMINMDMVGRLNDSSKTITIGGYGTSPTWGELYSKTGPEKLFEAAQYRFDSSGTGPSDHTSFYLKNIPVLFYFTGLHTDYHKPTDDFEKINYNGEAAIIKHIYSLLRATDKINAKLVFTKTREVQMGTTSRFSVTLGIMPDYTFSGAGVRADGVTEGRPAQKAGLQTGDIIMAIGEYKIASMESYMQTLGKFKKGEKTTITYTRAGKVLVTTAEF